jgi:hypothetical protein
VEILLDLLGTLRYEALRIQNEDKRTCKRIVTVGVSFPIVLTPIAG